MKKVLQWLKKEVVLVAAWLLAVISMFFVHPNREYVTYIDWRVLGILLTLMLIMAGLRKHGLFDCIAEALLARTRRLWQLAAILVFLCFFFSMLITNDVALITFVPFAILVLDKAGQKKQTLKIVVLQTIAANMGSMLTPLGNPQNLYLYNLSGYSLGQFLKIMLPYTGVAAVLLVIAILTLRGKQEAIAYEKEEREGKRASRFKVPVYLILFALSIAVVCRVLPWQGVMVATVLLVVVLDYELMFQVDYSLLLTFVGFFLFTGNMAKIPAISNWLQNLVQGREYLVSILTSQVISNVPATLLLSGFTWDYRTLIIGVNVGGLGTLIASMASLISYKAYASAETENKGRYILRFTLVSLAFLAVLTGCYLLIDRV